MGGVKTFVRVHRRAIITAGVVWGISLLAGLAWWLGSPLFLNTTVEEEFPYSSTAIVPAGMTQTQVEETMATLAGIDDEMSEAMPMMADAAVMAGPTVAPGGDATVVPTVAPTMAPAAGPTAVKDGMFRDGDGFHKGSGSAAVYRLADGSYVLRLEDFQVTNGPDLRVLLSTHPDPQGRGDVHDAEYVELGKLKGNRGNQNYPFPDDLSPEGYASVVIYCKPFQVLFSVAPLSEG